MLIAVDFDGTIVEHKYPAIGKELPFATQTLKQLIRDGHRLILWTIRHGETLDAAVEWCKERGVEFYAINSNYAEEDEFSGQRSPKVKCDMCIDDRNLGGLPDWGTIYNMITHNLKFDYSNLAPVGDSDSKKKRKRWLF